MYGIPKRTYPGWKGELVGDNIRLSRSVMNIADAGSSIGAVNVPRRDGSGRGLRANRGRGGCESSLQPLRGQGRIVGGGIGAVDPAAPPPTLTELLRDVGPALQIAGKQYVKAAPVVDWMIDYYPVAIVGLGVLVFGAAAVGAWYGSKQV